MLEVQIVSGALDIGSCNFPSITIQALQVIVWLFMNIAQNENLNVPPSRNKYSRYVLQAKECLASVGVPVLNEMVVLE